MVEIMRHQLDEAKKRFGVAYSRLEKMDAMVQVKPEIENTPYYKYLWQQVMDLNAAVLMAQQNFNRALRETIYG